MAQQNNPFYIEPARIEPQALAGIGQVVQQTREQNKRKQAQSAVLEAVQSNDPARIAEVVTQYPEFANAAKSAFGFTNAASEKAARETYRRALSDPDNAGQYLQQGIQQVTDARGRPDMMTRDFQMFQENPEQAIQAMKMGYASLDPEGYKSQFGAPGQSASRKSFAPVTIVNPDTQEKRLVSPTYDPNTGKAELSPFDMPEGFEISKETPEEKRQADVLAKGGEVTTKGQAQRQQTAINKGLDAADSFANIQRGLELLDTVKTGGLNAASLKAKQLFGVEGADEAELSSRLGKAVLSQLRETFGAAFTEREGARLANIEAGFGKSTEGNRRLLEQTKRIIKRAANRGIKAAEASGDQEAADDIREALAFRLGDGAQEQVIQVNPDDEALTWARANPDDPRAVQILKIQGTQ